VGEWSCVDCCRIVSYVAFSEVGIVGRCRFHKYSIDAIPWTLPICALVDLMFAFPPS
jgi:hypothetical protein